MKYGYARVSTTDQKLDLQINSLKSAGCEKIYQDKGISGSTTTRPQLDQLLDALQEGDSLVVWKLDRLGRDTLHVLQTINELEQRGVIFQSLTQDINTSTSTGKLFLQICAIMSENERNIIRERVLAGMDASRKRGVKPGRRAKLSREQLLKAQQMLDDGETTVNVARILEVDRSTLYRALKAQSDMLIPA